LGSDTYIWLIPTAPDVFQFPLLGSFTKFPKELKRRHTTFNSLYWVLKAMLVILKGGKIFQFPLLGS